MPKTSKTAQMTNMRSLILLLMALLSPALAQAQGTLTPTPQITFLDASGNPISNGKICTYAAGTTTPQATYFNPDLDISHVNANPIRTDSAGRPTTGGIYLSASSYKFLILTAGTDGTCATGTTVYSQDNVSAVPATAVALDVTGTAGTTIAAGNVVYLANGSGGTTTGRWYLGDADNTYSSSTASLVGIATTAIATGSSGAIRIGGRMTGLSGLAAGSDYYASATDGTLTATPPTNARFVGRADTTTTMVLAGGVGAVRMPDSDGSNSLVIRTSSDLTADRLLTFVPGDAARTVTLTGNPTLNQDVSTVGKPSFNTPGGCGGRLTATTGVPVTTGDVSGATSIFYTPFSLTDSPGRCGVFDGSSTWTTLAFTEITISVAACTASKPYDVFVFNNSGALNAEILVWTNGTTRATALVRQDGVFVKTGATTRRYVGTFFCNASGGQTDDTLAKRFVWNYYNRVRRELYQQDTTNSWTYTTATWRQWRAQTSNQVETIVGVAEGGINLQLIGNFANTNVGVSAGVGIGIGSTSAPGANVLLTRQQSPVANQYVAAGSSYAGVPAAGYMNWTMLEDSEATGTTTWYGTNGGQDLGPRTGLIGSIEG